jgi:phenylalanyl-tRNA synthetase beta chain
LTSLKGPDALAELLTGRGIEVEAIERQDQGFDQVVSAQVLEKNPHPQADRLSFCKVSLGQGEPLEIVCGAQNFKAGDKVVLAQVGAHLPNGLKITPNKIRGVTSYGMLCSEEELKLKESSEGILILSPDTALGQPLAQLLGRDDVVLTLKVTPNRGDCLSHFGVARETAAALGLRAKRTPASIYEFKQSPISVQLAADDACPQFAGLAIEGVKIGPSPDWVVKRLETLGSRSINNVVDATNLLMFELGQPVHAYDADKIRGRKIQARLAQSGEKLPLLDGTEVVLKQSELVIADEERSIALAGVMGGGNSEVELITKNLFLECAEFNASLVRQASATHQRKTDAAYRFERGVDPAGIVPAISRLADLILSFAGGKVQGGVLCQNPSRSNPQAYSREIRFELYYFNEFLGFKRDQVPLTLDQVEQLLKGLECQVTRDSKGWQVIPPSYRLDLSIPEDLAEEIARSVGYDEIPATIPPLSGSPVFGASSLPSLTLMNRAKTTLVRMGLHETVNFAFTSRTWLSRFGMTSSATLLNPLSEEHEALVPSLIPGLIRNALDNWNHHFGSEPLAVRLFEFRPTFTGPQTKIEAQGQMETGVKESWKLSLLLSGPRFSEALRSERGEVDFYDLKAMMDGLLTDLGARGVRYQPMTASRTGGNPLFHPGQSAEVLAGNTVAGHFGLLHPGLSKELKCRDKVWIAELDWAAIVKLSREANGVPAFKTWPQFPQMERDFALLVKNDVTSEKLCQIAIRAGKPFAKSAKVFDIYRGSQVAEGMTSVAVRVIFYDEARSLQEIEAENASAKILESWKKELGVDLRS